MKSFVENRKARAEYSIQETLEAGIMLSGGEVKMLRSGRGSLAGSYVRIMQGKAVLINAQIPAYPFSRQEDYEPTQTRTLLFHKHEIERLEQAQREKGLSLVPLEIYPSKRFIKVRVGIGKGKKQYERREEIRKRDLAREVMRDNKQKLR